MNVCKLFMKLQILVLYHRADLTLKCFHRFGKSETANKWWSVWFWHKQQRICLIETDPTVYKNVTVIKYISYILVHVRRKHKEEMSVE